MRFNYVLVNIHSPHTSMQFASIIKAIRSEAMIRHVIVECFTFEMRVIMWLLNCDATKPDGARCLLISMCTMYQQHPRPV